MMKTSTCALHVTDLEGGRQNSTCELQVTDRLGFASFVTDRAGFGRGLLSEEEGEERGVLSAERHEGLREQRLSGARSPHATSVCAWRKDESRDTVLLSVLALWGFEGI